MLEGESMEDTLKVFVYGTLKKGGRFASRFDEFRKSCKAGKVKGTLFSLGSFPGIVLSGDTEVRGEVHEYNNAKNVEAALDRIEGFISPGNLHNLYEKRKVNVETATGTEECYLYEFARSTKDLDKVSTGEWEV